MQRDYYKQYFHLERNHWWFRARSIILESQVRSRVPKGNSNLSILNAGVATGASSDMLSKIGKVTSVEYDEDCCIFLRKELGMEVTHASLTDLPFDDNSFDLVCAFDVIEHIKDDSKALQEIERVLKPGGTTCITVPAYMFLWSKHDIVNHHHRRYTSKLLKSRMNDAKLRTDYVSYFNFFLFAPIACIRTVSSLFNGKQSKGFVDNEDEVADSNYKYLNNYKMFSGLLYHVFKSESIFLSFGIRFPTGVSLISIGRKKA